MGYTAFYAMGIFGVASVGIYKSTMAPLSWQGLQMAGGAETFSSSLAAYVDLTTVLALFAAPAIVIFVPFVLRRTRTLRARIKLAPISIGPKFAACAFLALFGYGVVSHTYIRANWTDPNRWERRISQSPHAVFLQSVLNNFVWGDALPLSGEEADASDFVERTNNPTTYQPATQSNSSRPKNVLVIVLESTAMEYTSLAAGQGTFMHSPTPHLAQAAAQHGVVFENCYVQAPSSCKSLASLTAGIYPRTDWWLLVRDQPQFAVPTVAEVLAARGYRTCFAHSGYWSWKDRDVFLKSRGGQTLLDADTIAAEKVNSWGISDADMFDAVLQWIDDDPQQPFFALAYTIETHHPYVVRPPEIDFGVDDPNFNRYLNALHETDKQIGRMLQELKARNLLDDTLIAVTADHGESFGQHNQRIHSFAVYDPAVHVPLLLLHPSLADRPRRDSRLAAHVDLPATIADMLDVPTPSEWQGQSLFATHPRERNYFFCTGNEIILGLRQGSLKYHYYVESGYEELFDLSIDPGEANNLAATTDEGQQAQMAEFRRRLAGFVRHQQGFLGDKIR